MPFADDASAMTAVSAGDHEALDHLYRRYGRLAFSIAHRISGDRTIAEECTQDAFLTIWRRAGTFDPARGGLPTWLFAIVRNLTLSAIRRTHSTLELDQRADVSPDQAPDDAVVAGEAASRLAEAMAALPEPQSTVLQLAYFDGLSQSEIARRLGVPLGTVKGRVRLALERMRALVGDDAAVSGR